MAENSTDSGWRAEMDPEEHIGTYGAFLGGAKVASIIIAVILLGMAAFLL